LARLAGRARHTQDIDLYRQGGATTTESEVALRRAAGRDLDEMFSFAILDELGYLDLGPGGPLVFQFCAERYERGGLLITTNLDFARGVEVSTDATLTPTLLDRLTHHAHVLLLEGESYRFKESTRSEEVAPTPISAEAALSKSNTTSGREVVTL
jgi:hypothetical protein